MSILLKRRPLLRRPKQAATSIRCRTACRFEQDAKLEVGERSSHLQYLQRWTAFPFVLRSLEHTPQKNGRSMIPSGTPAKVHLRAILLIASYSLMFWLSLMGFVLSLIGAFVKPQPEFAFGYAFFGILLSASLFAAAAEYRRNGTQHFERRDNDID
ncbi:hypothetical protein [Acidicapsa ligni]|uniref:hypothetical protein n=1 Tax=Acidicapsa ligni TaxID=542300 RepID=UPI0021E008F3|nr:hypothetical protein [Acidicapsa ligni]